MNKKSKGMAILIISIIVIIGFIIPWIVHCDSPNIVSEVTADGMLGYIIGYLSFITTGLLAVYAIYQTKQSNDIAQKYNDLTLQLIEIDKNNHKLQIRPFITVTKYDVINYSQNDILYSDDKLFIQVGDLDSSSNINGITLTITNTTESFLTFQYGGAEKVDAEIDWKHSSFGKYNTQNMKISLMPGKSKDIVFIADDNFILDHESKSVNLSFFLENRFTKRYKETIEMIFLNVSKNNDTIYANLVFQNFHIYRFDYNKDKITEIEEEL